MDGKVLGVERRRRWNRDEKARIVEETLMPGAVVCEVARRPAALRRACSSHGEGRRELLNRAGETVRFCFRLRSERRRPRDPKGGKTVARSSEAQPTKAKSRDDRNRAWRRRGVRVDSVVDAEALRRVLSVLSER